MIQDYVIAQSLIENNSLTLRGLVMGEELESVHSVLDKYLPPDELDRVNRILLGNKLE
jgi:hypothetical protein